MSFLLESDNNGYLYQDTNTIRELIEAENEWNRGNPNNTEVPITFRTISYGELIRSEPEVDQVTPIGSLRFCNAVGAMQGAKPVSAINVPAALESYAGRKIFRYVGDERLKRLLSEYEGVVVKPADQPKRFDCVELHERDIASFAAKNPPPYFVSEKIQQKIVAEWRVFFWNHRIIGLAPYCLYKWIAPNEDVCKEMLQSWTDAPIAGTLDVAILETGDNVVIEAHPLISCGLYGFERRELLSMHRAAWREHVEKKQQRHFKDVKINNHNCYLFAC